MENNSIEKQEDSEIPFWKKRRYHIVFMVLPGLSTLLNLRVNLSVAIVAMTQKVNVTLSNGTVVEEQEFDWDVKQQGLLLSSFFYGYIFTQVLGGYLGARFGGHLIYGIGCGATAVLTLLTPVAAKAHIGLLLCVRIVQGLFGGLCYPSLQAIWANWAPVYERAFMGNFAYTGYYIGIIAAMLLSGLISDALGWEFIFYIFGAFGCLWYIGWLFVVKAGPEVDPFITEAEKRYILSSIGDRSQTKKISHPWKDILTSSAVWAVLVASIVTMWGSYTLMTQLPLFLYDTLDYDLGTTGIMASIPYIVMVCVLFVTGYLADWLQVKGYLKTHQVRRYFTCGSFIVQMIFMFLTAFTNNPTNSIIFITLGVAANALTWSGYGVCPLDMAPSHASIVYGLSNTLGTLSGILSPIITGNIVTDHSRDQWRIVFYICAGFYLFGLIFSWFFLQGKLQPWAKIDIEILEAKKRKNVEKIASDSGSE